jgi:hypothetical protein
MIRLVRMLVSLRRRCDLSSKLMTEKRHFGFVFAGFRIPPQTSEADGAKSTERSVSTGLDYNVS